MTLRLWFYYQTLPHRHLALSWLLQGAPWHKRLLLLLVYPKVRGGILRRMNINADTAKHSEQRFRAALDRLDRALDGHRFLVEDRFSRADLTACALLSPCCLPDDEASARFPAAVLKLRDELKGRRLYQWVHSVYERYRQPMPEDTPSVSRAGGSTRPRHECRSSASETLDVGSISARRFRSTISTDGPSPSTGKSTALRLTSNSRPSGLEVALGRGTNALSASLLLPNGTCARGWRDDG